MSKAIKRLMKGKKISLFQSTITNPVAAAPRIVEPDDFEFSAMLKAGVEISGTISLTDSIEKALAKYAGKKAEKEDLEDIIGETMYAIEIEFPTKSIIDADISKNGKARFKVKDNTTVHMRIKPFKLIHASRRKDGKIGYIVRFLDESRYDDVCFDENESLKKVTKIPRILVGDDMKLNISNLASDIIQYGYDHDNADKLIDTAFLKANRKPVIIATNDDDYRLNGSTQNCLPDSSDPEDTNDDNIDGLDITEF